MRADDLIQRSVFTARAGLNRFFDEGMSRWPEEKLRPLFSHADLDHPAIQKALSEWESSGYITLDRSPDCYLTIRTIIHPAA